MAKTSQCYATGTPVPNHSREEKPELLTGHAARRYAGSVKPLIAVAGHQLQPGVVAKWHDRGAAAVPDRFVQAIHTAGAREAILMPVHIEPREAQEILERFDGLLLTGGGDVHPRHYQGEMRQEIYGVNEERDTFDRTLTIAAIDLGMPVLGVCRGMQMLNVALGGTLDPHLPDRPELGPHDRADGSERHVAHAVRLQPDTRAARAARTEELDVPSMHHQGVEKLGDGLLASGWSPDGLVEAVEHEDGWVVGVQWHPEITAAGDPANQGFFDALAEQARRYLEG